VVVNLRLLLLLSVGGIFSFVSYRAEFMICIYLGDSTGWVEKKRWWRLPYGWGTVGLVVVAAAARTERTKRCGCSSHVRRI